MTQGSQTYLPLRVNMAGVIPVIFAASVMTIPPTLGQLIGQNRKASARTSPPSSPRRLALRGRRVHSDHRLHVLLYGGDVQPGRSGRQPEEVRRVHPRGQTGRPTAEFLDRILARLTLPGALFLAAIAALPTVLIDRTGANFAFGGTSILIVIGVALDTMKRLEAQLMMRNYEGFLK